VTATAAEMAAVVALAFGCVAVLAVARLVRPVRPLPAPDPSLAYAREVVRFAVRPGFGAFVDELVEVLPAPCGWTVRLGDGEPVLAADAVQLGVLVERYHRAQTGGGR
jgi:hypothetical protein